VSAYHCILYW